MRWPADSMISSRSIMQALSGIEDVWGGRARIRPTVLRVHDAPRLLIEDEAINRMAPSLGRLRGATKQRRTRVMRPSSPKLCIYLDVSGSMHKRNRHISFRGEIEGGDPRKCHEQLVSGLHNVPESASTRSRNPTAPQAHLPHRWRVPLQSAPR
jgi:hypothetical protein